MSGLNGLAVISLLVGTLVIACGGGSSLNPPPPVIQKALVHPSDRQMDATGYAYNIRTTEGMSIADSVAAQAALPGNVILWPGRVRDLGYGDLTTLFTTAATHANFTHFYTYDELGWKNGTIDFADVQIAHNAAVQATTYGLKPVVTLMPRVVLDPNFSLPDVNIYKVIVLDPYPTVGGMGVTGVPWKGNLMSSLLHGSVIKLRGMGYTGDFWYAYQAFSVAGTDDAANRAMFTTQREAIADALALGMSGIIPFGLDLGPDAKAREPWIVPGREGPYLDLLLP